MQHITLRKLSILPLLTWVVAEISVNTAAVNGLKEVPGFTYLGFTPNEDTASAYSASKGDSSKVTLQSLVGRQPRTFTYYYLSNAEANQTAAQIDCKKIFDGTLANVQNANKDTDLRHSLELVGSDGPFWTSGRRYTSSGPWLWSSNLAPIVYFNWIQGEPINNFNCLGVYRQGIEYGWWSNPCDYKLRYICEV